MTSSVVGWLWAHRGRETSSVVGPHDSVGPVVSSWGRRRRREEEEEEEKEAVVVLWARREEGVE